MYSDKMIDEQNTNNNEFLESCIEDFGALKISALTSANKIKPYVKKVTIGPNATGEDEIKVTISEIKIPPSKRSNIKSRLGPLNCLKSANILEDDIENSPCNDDSSVTLLKEQMGCNIMNVNMLRYENSKNNRHTVRKKVRDLQTKFNNVDQNLYIKSTQEFNNSQCFLNKRLQKIETDILENLEKHQFDVNKKKQLIIQKHEEQCQELLKKSLELKHDQEIRRQRLMKKAELDAIFVCQKEFRQEYENFIQQFRSYKDVTSQQVFTEYGNELKVLVNNMEKVTHKCKIESIKSEDVMNAKQLVNSLKNHCSLMNSEYFNRIEFHNNQLLKEQEQLQCVKDPDEKPIKIIEEVQTEVVPQNSGINQVESKLSTNSSEYEHGNKLNWKKLAEYRNFIINFSTQYKELKADSNLKKFRFDCQKAVNIPVNAIAGKGELHTQDKLEKLDTLLAGKPVRIGEMELCAGRHPQGVAYCFDLLAKNIVKQGALVSSNPESAFPIAYVIAALWSKYPDFGKLVLGYFYEKCPYLVPVYPIKTFDMTEEEYFRLLGYDISSDGMIEPKDLFLKRICGTARLYFAIMIVSCDNHPFSLENAWRWISHILNIAPKPDISASLIVQCLDVTGNAQIYCYKKQFLKIILALINEYMVELGKVDSGGPYARLKEFLLKTMETGVINPPKLTTNVESIEYL